MIAIDVPSVTTLPPVPLRPAGLEASRDPGQAVSPPPPAPSTGWWHRIRRARRALVALGAALIVGNLVILGASFAAAQIVGTSDIPAIGRIKNLAGVDSRVIRGAAPTGMGDYTALADAGVTTVVDLRSDSEIRQPDQEELADLGIEIVRIPIRDGQTPSAVEVHQFLGAVKDSDGLVFVHCGAGVGRTGVMSAAYLVATGQASPIKATARNLAIGPPSLEQIAFAAGLGDGPSGPSEVVVGLSRLLDAPRRTWHRLGF